MLALIYLGVAICVGERLSGRFCRFVSVTHRWATATLVGLVLSGGFTYLAARSFASSSKPLLWGDLLFFAAASIFLLNFRPKRDPSLVRPRAPGSETWDWVALALYVVLACWMMFATLGWKNGIVQIGITQWSDYGPNTAIVQSFAVGHNFPAQYPHYAGEPIRYHFLFYFLAGNLEFLGLNLVWSVNILSVLTLVSMLALVIALGEVLFKSRVVGRIASAFFFFHGTLNLVPFLRKQTSFKGALQATYNLRDYLSSGYGYRGEDWGIWTQVVFINQRHLATSIGIFLIVLIFLFDRYQEAARQKQLARAESNLGIEGAARWGWARRWKSRRRRRASLSPPVTSNSSPLADKPSLAEDGPAAPRDGDVATEAAFVGETATQGDSPFDEYSYRAPDIVSGEEAQTFEELPSVEQSSPVRETIAGSEAEPSDPVESLEEPSQAANYASAGEPQTFNTLAYDEYIHSAPDTTSVSAAQESEALEFVKQSSQEHDTLPAGEEETSNTPASVEQSPPQPDAASGSETQSPSAPVPESVPETSRGVVGRLVHDNLVSGRGFIFSGFLLGVLPYWNSPVFTAAFAVLLFLFVLFPCRRYMLGLAITAAVVALPQVLALRAGNARSGASLIHWGYTLGNVPVLQVVKYLGFTFGVKWVLILIGLLFGSWLHWRLFIAIFSLFLLTFCFQFSEEALANHKFVNIWLVLANLFVAYGLWRLWRLVKGWWSIPFRLLAILLATPIIVGGAIDFFPIHNGTFIETGYANDRLVKWVQTETKPDAIFLTDKFVNHQILLAGRRIWFGYTYFTWSAGYDLPKRETAYRQMFESKNAHQVFTLLKTNGIDYVAFDSTIRGTFKNNNEQQVYAPNFKKVFDGAEYWTVTIYKVPENADFVPASSTPATGGPTAQGVTVFEGGMGKENGQSNFPRGLAVDKTGNILLCDTNNGRIQKFSPTGTFLSAFGKPGQAPGEFREPGGLAVDSSGNIYVADFANNRVQKLKPDGTFLSELKGPDPGFFGPRDIFIGPDNSILVLDQGNARVVRFDSNGKVAAVWGSRGQEDGQFSEASSVAVDGKNNRVYVADPRNKRIEVFDPNGKFIAKWPVEQWLPTGWYFQALAVDSQAGRLYASSPTDEVLVFDLTGKKIGALRPKPPDKLEGASCLVLVKGKLYVLNTYASRVSVIELETK